MSPPPPGPAAKGSRVTEVVVLTTAMLTFISCWRAGAVVLNDLASTAFYVSGIAEQAIGKSAPWFILAVMAFSACMLAVYVEGSSMFVRGGVYTVVKNAMGSTLAKASVSALMFDYILTGPVSSVSAGQYVAGLLNQSFPVLRIGWHINPDHFSVLFALAVTAYFWRMNIEGIEESSEKSMRIVQLTGVMGAVLLAWAGYTAFTRGVRWPPFSLSFGREALGWLDGFDWVKSCTVAAILVGLGHSFLGMSGLETLAQVYREMEAPKLKNLKRAAVFVFLFAFVLTTVTSFLSVMIIPDQVRVHYLDNLLGGLAMSVAGPYRVRLVLQAFVVVVGAMILSGAVNTSIIGANGVLNRLAEDGIMADWFRWLHPVYGTTHRVIHLVVGLQVVTILLCRGDVYLLGEAYAFGMLWSFVFLTASLVVLRFKDRTPREWMVPLNVRWRQLEFPLGISLIFLVLLTVAITNLLTKKVATVSGVVFTIVFYLIFRFSESFNRRRETSNQAQREKLNLRLSPDLSAVLPAIKQPNRTLIALRDANDLYTLQRAIQDMSPKTDLIVFHSKRMSGLRFGGTISSLGPDQEGLFSSVIRIAEKAGKTVVPMMVVSNDSSYAIAQTALAVGATEVVLGVSRQGTEAQVERLAMLWGALGTGSTASVKVTFYRLSGYKMQIEI